MSAGFNIAALSRRTGVAADTLRKWEQRYGVLHPARTAGGQRRYDELDVDRVEWLRERLAEGYRIGDAAALLGAGDWEAARSPEDVRAALLAAVAAGDHVTLDRLLDQAFRLELPVLFARVLEPFLQEVGARWERRELSVAHEHLATQAVRARLGRRLAESRGGIRGTAVLACAPGERHDIGLLMLAVLMRADGWEVAYLGPETPLEAATSLSDGLHARLLCVSATLIENVPDSLHSLVGASRNGTRVVIGGAAAGEAVAARIGAVAIRRGVVEAVVQLRTLAG